MGRSPCCDKVGLKKGPWTPEEDQKLLAYIEEHGHGSWRALPTKAGLQRCGKSCRLRWTNYLRPDIKRGKFSLQEEQTIIQLHALLGNRWSAIATHMPKRTDNEIKNYWNTHLKKRLAKMGIDPVTHKPKSDALLSNDNQPKTAANLSHMAQWESARLEAEARLVRQSKLRGTFQNPNLLNQTTSRIDLESSTSTLSYSENVTQGSNHLPEYTSITSFTSGINDMTMTINDTNEHVSSGNFVETFTDLLLNGNSGDHRSVSGDDEDTDNGGSGSGNGGTNSSDYSEDDKNYWNSILHLVNSSPSDSPVF